MDRHQFFLMICAYHSIYIYLGRLLPTTSVYHLPHTLSHSTSFSTNNYRLTKWSAPFSYTIRTPTNLPCSSTPTTILWILDESLSLHLLMSHILPPHYLPHFRNHSLPHYLTKFFNTYKLQPHLLQSILVSHMHISTTLNTPPKPSTSLPMTL